MYLTNPTRSLSDDVYIGLYFTRKSTAAAVEWLLGDVVPPIYLTKRPEWGPEYPDRADLQSVRATYVKITTDILNLNYKLSTFAFLTQSQLHTAN